MNTTRRSQSVVPFGVGSIVEFETEALMPAGLDVWPVKEAQRLFDDRLAGRLGVSHFCVPPPRIRRGASPETMAPLPYVRFPQWHFCPRCRFLKEVPLFAAQPPRCNNAESSPRLGERTPCGRLSEKKRFRLQPVRFVVACAAGHIEDFPWNAWAHSKGKKQIDRSDGCQPPKLYFYATRVGGLSGLVVECANCPAKRSMMGSTNPQGLSGLHCNGHRPWLGGEGSSNECDGGGTDTGMFALQRGASNVYFPIVSSSILIPPFSTRIHQFLSEPNVRNMLESAREGGEIPTVAFRMAAAFCGADEDALRKGYESMHSSHQASHDTHLDEIAFRFAEYEALRQERREPDDLLRCRPQVMAEYDQVVRDHIAGVSLVERLAETRVLTGFHRIRPNDQRPAELSKNTMNWLPGFRVHGEGIFLELRRDKISQVIGRTDPRSDALLKRSVRYRGALLPVTRELLLVHSFAHLLIKRLAFEAGYGTSSIRERIYVGSMANGNRMTGLLLYTAAGDADGTLGGLVSQGRPGRLEHALIGAMEEARWCASDPICGESKGQGPDSMNLAACHACCLLPETSCEFQNRFLDRNEVIRLFGGAVLAAAV